MLVVRAEYLKTVKQSCCCAAWANIFGARECLSVLSFGSAQLSVRLLQGRTSAESNKMSLQYVEPVSSFPVGIFAKGGGNQKPGTRAPIGQGAGKPAKKAVKKAVKKAAKKATKKKKK